MAYLTQAEYYGDSDNYGGYQYTSLSDIVNNFLLMYTGNQSLVNNEPRFKVMFHAKRAIAELNMDSFKSVKVLELDVTQELRFIMPSDYVNWVRVSVYKNGSLYPVRENNRTNFAKSYLQDNSGSIQLSGDNVIEDISSLTQDRLDGMDMQPYYNEGHMLHGQMGYHCDGTWYMNLPLGKRFGMETSEPSGHTFSIDRHSGVFNFSSSMAGETCVLEYISDGLESNDASSIKVNKMFEDYVYSYIEYAIIGSKHGVQEYIVRRLKNKRRALLMNARLRISNIKPSKLFVALRGQDKWLK